GDNDERVLSLAATAARIVMTDDWGFGEMTVRHGRPAAGVIILSLYALSAGAREAYAIERISEIADRALGHLSNIEPRRIRTRPLPAAGLRRSVGWESGARQITGYAFGMSWCCRGGLASQLPSGL
ncbi:MAG: DUF5615 family PIN-like protein, partial [Vicinamibacterales bacterium]